MMLCGTLLSINNKPILFLSNSTTITSRSMLCMWICNIAVQACHKSFLLVRTLAKCPNEYIFQSMGDACRIMPAQEWTPFLC
jgi:hypothetical protein